MLDTHFSSELQSALINRETELIKGINTHSEESGSLMRMFSSPSFHLLLGFGPEAPGENMADTVLSRTTRAAVL